MRLWDICRLLQVEMVCLSVSAVLEQMETSHHPPHESSLPALNQTNQSGARELKTMRVQKTQSSYI